MHRRSFLALPVAAGTAVGQTHDTTRHRPPNVLLLLYDKCRTDAIGAYTGQKQITPNLNELAASGTRFEHAYTPQALCAPARASILTGLYPHGHGVRYNPYPRPV